MRRLYAIHPLLFNIYFMLFIYAHNITEVSFNQIIMPVAISIAVLIVLFCIIFALVKNIAKANIVLTVLVVLFYLYGQVFVFLENKGLNVAFYHHYQIIPGLFIVLSYLIYILRISQKDFTSLIRTLTAISLVLICINIVTIITSEISVSAHKDKYINDNIAKDVPTDNGKVSRYPDIYFILLDEYAGLKAIKTEYNYDNKYFVDYLKSKNFIILENQTTKYSSTWPILASILNMQYVDKDAPHKELYGTILESKVSKFLKSKGYKYIFNSDQKLFNGTSTNTYATIDFEGLKETFNLSSDSQNISPFNEMLLRTTMLRLYYCQMMGDGLWLRKNETQKLQLLDKVITMQGPKFVFSHHLISHEPFLFNAEGGIVSAQNHKNWLDKRYYLDTYKYTGKAISDIVTNILAKSATPPIIMIISDHGPRGLSVGRIWEDTFAAYYIPGVNATIDLKGSQINNFKYLFNQYFNQNYDLTVTN